MEDRRTSSEAQRVGGQEANSAEASHALSQPLRTTGRVMAPPEQRPVMLEQIGAWIEGYQGYRGPSPLTISPVGSHGGQAQAASRNDAPQALSPFTRPAVRPPPGFEHRFSAQTPALAADTLDDFLRLRDANYRPPLSGQIGYGDIRRMIAQLSGRATEEDVSPRTRSRRLLPSPDALTGRENALPSQGSMDLQTGGLDETTSNAIQAVARPNTNIGAIAESSPAFPPLDPRPPFGSNADGHPIRRNRSFDDPRAKTPSPPPSEDADSPPPLASPFEDPGSSSPTGTPQASSNTPLFQESDFPPLPTKDVKFGTMRGGARKRQRGRGRKSKRNSRATQDSELDLDNQVSVTN